MQTREHNQSFHRHKQTSHTVIIFVCKIIIIIDGRYYKEVIFFWLTHSVYSSYSKSNFHKWNIMYLYLYLYIGSFGVGRPLSVYPHFQPLCNRKGGEENHKACNSQCAFMFLPTQTASIMLTNMGQSLLTWSPARGISLAEDMVQGRACFPFQFISKINHLSKLNVRGWLLCLSSKLVRRLIKASVCCEWIVKRPTSPF